MTFSERILVLAFALSITLALVIIAAHFSEPLRLTY